MAYETIRYDVDDDGILVITLARPEKLNSFTVDMCAELEDAFACASRDDTVRAVIVTGEGRAFCAGMDLSVAGNVFGLDETLRPTMADMRDRLSDHAIQNGVRDTGGRVSLAIFGCLKPVIGAVNGVAVGIGATMLLPMDFRMASTQSRFGFVFSRLGITAEACSTWFLPRIVGLEQTLEWMYSAELFPAQEALEKGLVRALYQPESLIKEAKCFARKLVEGRSPVSIALIRQMVFRNSAQPHPLEAHRVESLAMFYTSLADGKEGVQSVMEKRPPAFNNGLANLPPFVPWD